MLRGNHFHDLSGRLMLYTGQGTLENNRISDVLTHVGFSALDTDTGGRPYDILIKGNYFQRGSADILPWSVSPETPITEDIGVIGNSHVSAHWDIQYTDRPAFVDNYFEQVDDNDDGNRGLIEVWKVRDLRLAGNLHYNAINLNWVTSENSGDTSTTALNRDNVIIPIRDMIIVDNTDPSPSFVKTGTWNSSTYAHHNFHGNDNLWSESTASATYRPDLPTTGKYNVFAISNGGTDRGQTVTYLITHAQGTSSVVCNQRTANQGWVNLGSFTFAAGTTGNVKVSTSGAGGRVVADAIRFEH